MNLKAYTGVGSRQTPTPVILLMEQIGEVMARKGWTLRSGAAQGADQAFEAGALRGHPRGLDGLTRADSSLLEIYLPWESFNGSRSPRYKPQGEAFAIARELHPAWDRLNSAGRRLHARSVHQVLGPDVEDPSPSRFLLCWTYDGRGGGGTGTSIRVARRWRVPVWDMGDPTVLDAFQSWVTDQTEPSGGRIPVAGR